MRKKIQAITSVLLAVLLLTAALPFSVSAATATQDSVGASSGITGYCRWTLDDDRKLTISGNGAMGDYVYDYLWDSEKIAPWGTSIRKAIIENGVTNIGDYAFYNCKKLTNITIPDSVTSIGKDAFFDCICLTSVTIHDSVTSIGENAFSGCTGLKRVNISDIAAWCDISFSGSASNPLCNAQLYLNNELVTDLVIPDDVMSIGEYAFSGCIGLTSVTIPDSVTSIANCAFWCCTGLTSVTIPDRVKSIGNYAFSGCTGLTSVTIPDSVTSIGDRAFYGCTGLTSVTIPDSVTSIGNYAFYNCKNLTIYGKEGSYAQTYANKESIPFVAVADTAIGDANGDNKIDVNDVTAIQRFFAEYEDFTPAQLAAADTDGNGVVDINDATHLQRYLAEYDVVLGKQS